MLLNTDSGIFYEFVPAGEIFAENPTRLSLKDVEIGVNYALIINSNAGLWGYNIGDTIKFVSTNPYRIIVSGRIKHFISAFGEHVIGEEVEKAMLDTLEATNATIAEFTVAPLVGGEQEHSYHEWFIEFENLPADPGNFQSLLDANMRKQNVYYDDLIAGKILLPLQVTMIRKNGFIEYMKSIGKLGGQNKVARLSNDRQIANSLIPWILV
jgi:GH3 auxin-responsive promoter